MRWRSPERTWLKLYVYLRSCACSNLASLGICHSHSPHICNSSLSCLGPAPAVGAVELLVPPLSPGSTSWDLSTETTQKETPFTGTDQQQGDTSLKESRPRLLCYKPKRNVERWVTQTEIEPPLWCFWGRRQHVGLPGVTDTHTSRSRKLETNDTRKAGKQQRELGPVCAAEPRPSPTDKLRLSRCEAAGQFLSRCLIFFPFDRTLTSRLAPLPLLHVSSGSRDLSQTDVSVSVCVWSSWGQTCLTTHVCCCCEPASSRRLVLSLCCREAPPTPEAAWLREER